jgi:integrase
MTIKVELHKRAKRLQSGRKVQYWTLRWWGTDGKRYSESIGTVGEMTKNEAETARRAKEQAISGGVVPRDKPQAMTLVDFFKHDTETVRGTVKLNTLESMKHAAAHAKKVWGDTTLVASIDDKQVLRLKTHLLDKVKVAGSTYAKTCRTLKAIFNRAVKQGLIHKNPFVGVRVPKTQSRRKRIFSPEETRAMRAVAPSPWWTTFIAVAETTGLRKAELIHLMRSDIDMGNKTLRVSAKRAGTFTVKGQGTFPILEWSAKSHEERTVPLPDPTLQMLIHLQSESDGSPYVFLTLERLRKVSEEIATKGQLGPNYEPINNMKARLDLIQRKARQLLAQERGVAVEDLPWIPGTLHDLRRTYGTRMARVVPMHVLKEYMGHAKITTTQEYYLAAETEDAERAREAMGRMFGQPDAPSEGRT